MRGIESIWQASTSDAEGFSCLVDISGPNPVETAAHGELRLLLESTAAGIFGTDVEGRCIFANPACLHALGYQNPVDLLGKNTHDLIHHTRLDGASCSGEGCPLLTPLYTGQGTHVVDDILWRGDGKGFYVEYWSNPLRKGNEIVGTVVAFTDITERKRAELALREGVERLRRAQQVSGIGTFEWDIQTGVNRWTPELEVMYGLQPGSFTGTQAAWEALVHHEDRLIATQHVQRALESGLPMEAEWRIVWPDGSIHWLAGRWQVFKDERGMPVRMTGVNIDITQRKRVEQALRESEQRFRLVANTAPVMIWMSGPDKLCTYFNQPWLEFTGRPLEQELGNGWAEGVHPEDLPRCLGTYAESFDRRLPFRLQYRLRRHDGEYRWILDTGVPRFNQDGSFAGYIGSCVDETDRRRAEEALRAMSGKLIAAQEDERRRIARELHDDINQRLAILAIELDQLKNNPSLLGTALGERVERLFGRTQEISSDVQLLSHQLHSSNLQCLGIISAVESFCREIADHHKVDIDFTHSGVPTFLPSDLSLGVFRVLQEALRNAVKHSGAQKFEVRLLGARGSIQLTVRDSGAGFDPEMAMNGKGLGLISMRERVNLLKGRISIISNPNGGTEVTVTIPVASVKATAEAA